MLRSLEDLHKYRIHAIDGDVGTVKDVLFDDHDWTIRYFVVDTGTWLPGRKVLVSPIAIGKADWAAREVRALLTKDQIKDSPGVDEDQPVSRQAEARLAEYYAWPMYWSVPDPAAVPPALQRVVVPEAAQTEVKRRKRDPHLRSQREVAGYKIEARDGSMGHVEDFIGDDTDWVIRFLVVDTSVWLPGKRVLISPSWVTNVDWKQGKVAVDLDKDQVENAPPYDPTTPINREYEMRLYDFYGRPV